MRINARHRSRRLFRLRTILLVVMLSVLVLPIASVFLFRFYENELVRRTEEQLIAQAAVMAATYRELLQPTIFAPNITSSATSDPNSDTKTDHRPDLESNASSGAASDNATLVTDIPNSISSRILNNQLGWSQQTYYMPIAPTLDLAGYDVLPRRDEVIPAKQRIAQAAWEVGRRMQSILLDSQQVTLAGMRILDQHGTVIAGRSELGGSLRHVQEVKKALSGSYSAVIRERISDQPQPPIASISRGTGIRVFVAFPIKHEGKVLGVVYLSRTPQNILKHMYQIRGKLLLLGLMLVLVTGLLVLFISSRLSRPIRELIGQTQLLTKGEQSTISAIHEPGTYELAQLSQSFVEMSEALHERSNYIHRFASHVSHEFKTPLTSMQGALELLQEHADDMPQEQRQRFLDNLYEDTQRLRRLVNRLLEQARADALEPSAERTDLYSILALLRDSFGERGLLIRYPETENSLWLNIAPVALETVLSNLFENSLQHNADRILVAVKQIEEHCQMTVQDNGAGISKANQENVFTPFFTTQRDEGGTGLGLGIVQSLLQTWKGSIRLLSSEQGTCFELELGLANERMGGA